MADHWQPQQSRLRRLQAQQNQSKLASVEGRVRQAAPVPYKTDIEQPPFNMHVGPTPPDDVYLGRYWFHEGAPGGPSSYSDVVPENMRILRTNVYSPNDTPTTDVLPSQIVGGDDAWNADLATYTYTAVSWANPGPSAHWARAVGDLPAEVKALGAAGAVTSLTCHLTAEYHDSLPIEGQAGLAYILALRVNAGYPIYLVRAGATYDAFRPHALGIQSYTSAIWVDATQNTVTLADINEGIANGEVSIQTALTINGNPSHTSVTCYKMTFDVATELPEGPAGRLKIWTGSEWTNATYRVGD